ncbi:MAG: restriction endonuclease subunit S, partial [Flavobacterium sp.]|nr:restriction endonuclease subunit S [Flavobacterium sp.]
MSNISNTTLGDLVEFQRGYDLPKSQFIEGNVPVISSNGVLGYHNVPKVKAPGITIGRSGTVGLPHFINKDFFPHNTALFIKDFKGNYPRYIYYLIKTLGLNDYKSGSGVPTMNRNHLHPIKVRAFLDLEEQHKIAKVLSDLDTKIEINNRINSELEAMAKTLYDYWFVQFDFPYSPPSEGCPQDGVVFGKPYKSTGGKMVWNEELKREIPEGWDCVLLGEMGNFKNGVNYDPSKPGNIACPIINVRNISATSYFLKNSDLDIIYLNQSDVQKYAVHEGSIIIARSGIPGATRLISDFAENTLYCGFAIHYELNDLALKIPVFFYLKSIEEMIKNGSGGTILKNVNQATLNNLQVVFPKKETTISQFNKLIKPLFNKIN